MSESAYAYSIRKQNRPAARERIRNGVFKNHRIGKAREVEPVEVVVRPRVSYDVDRRLHFDAYDVTYSNGDKLTYTLLEP
jgi:hypothetical protein